VKVLEAHCEREKRDPATIARSLMCAYITGASEAEVQRKVEGLSAPPRANVLVGTPFQIVERIREYEAEGVSRIMMQHFNPPSREELAFVAEEILPRV
jgi:alkanesulfonate monooxygenase SsuD/methylene tetrahydromethanopterin reductase-like flavin-dependent oxidoreductase (luciferase family)